MNKALTYMLLSTLLFSCMHVLVKAMDHFSIYQLIFSRAIISFGLCVIGLRAKKVSIWGNNKKLLLTRGVLGTLSLSGFFYALHHMPLASTITVTNLRPILILLLGVIFLKERINPWVWISFVVSFLGVLLIKGFDERISNKELLIVLAATIISSFSSIAIRKLKDTDHALVVVFYFTLVTLPFYTPLAFLHWVTPASLLEWTALLGVGLFTHFAQYFMTKGFHTGNFSSVASFSYLGLLFAFGFGYFIFGETYPLQAFLGFGLIILGLIGGMVLKNTKSQTSSS